MRLFLTMIGAIGFGLLGVIGYVMIPGTGYRPSAPEAMTSPDEQQAFATQAERPGEVPLADVSPRVAPIKNTAAAALKGAYPLVLQGRLDDALALLNASIQAHPNDPTTYNARSFIYVQQQHLDLARQDLMKCLELGDKSPLTRFDLAEIDFLQKNYDAARPGFAALESDPDRGDLSSFKVFLCDLLAGHEDQAGKELQLFDLKGMNASYYFANVAWDIYHQKPEEARNWLDSASRIYSPQKMDLYTFSLRNLGYLPLPPSLTNP